MEYLIGLLLAGVVVVFSALIGLDRERSFYVTTLVVVASYYALFAVMGGSVHTLIIEILAASVFCIPSRIWLQRKSMAGGRWVDRPWSIRSYSSRIH